MVFSSFMLGFLGSAVLYFPDFISWNPETRMKSRKIENNMRILPLLPVLLASGKLFYAGNITRRRNPHQT